MYTLLMVVIVLASIFLMAIVLMQSSKGGGLAGTFGGAGGGMNTMFGTRRTADFLSKATWWLAGTVGALALVINLFFLPGVTTEDQRDSIIQGSRQGVPTQPSVPQQQQQAPTQQMPGQQ